MEQYLSDGVENIMKGMSKTFLTNPKSAVFFMKYAQAAGAAAEKRRAAKQNGEHISSFFDRQYYQPVQSSLQGLLCMGKPYLRRRNKAGRSARGTVG